MANQQVGDRGRRIVLRRADDRLILDMASVNAAKRNRLTVSMIATAWQNAAAARCHDDVKLLAISVEFAEPIGVSLVIPTVAIDPHDRALFAYRSKHRISRVVLANEFVASSVITLMGDRVGRNTWTLRTAYCGHLAMPEPTDRRAMRESGYSRDAMVRFWCHNAFIYLPTADGFITEPYESSWVEVLTGQFPFVDELQAEL